MSLLIVPATSDGIRPVFVVPRSTFAPPTSSTVTVVNPNTLVLMEKARSAGQGARVVECAAHVVHTSDHGATAGAVTTNSGAPALNHAVRHGPGRSVLPYRRGLERPASRIGDDIQTSPVGCPAHFLRLYALNPW